MYLVNEFLSYIELYELHILIKSYSTCFAIALVDSENKLEYMILILYVSSNSSKFRLKNNELELQYRFNGQKKGE